MSKESAMSLATGQPTNNVNPSLITGAMNSVPRETEGASPGLAPTEPVINGIDSDRFAALAKKEAKLQKEREEWKQTTAKERAEIEDLKKKLKDPYDKIQAFEALKAKDPVAALKEIGFSETDIFNYLASQEKKEPTVEEIAKAAASEELGKYKEEQAKVADESKKARDKNLITQYSTQISDAIKANPEKYEYANYYGEQASELAMEFATENVKLNGELLSPDEIAQAVEEYYEEQDKAMSVIKKRNPITGEPLAKGPDAGFTKTPTRTRTLSPQPGVEAPKPIKTLTNKVTATAASTITRRETYDQKKERIIAALKSGTYVPPKQAYSAHFASIYTVLET